MPRSDEFYYVLLSAWDSAGSYDQIGFSDTYGVWGLTYAWTTGPPRNPTYHYSSNAKAVSLGLAYTFCITTQDGFAHFVAYLGSSQFWFLDTPTGGKYLVVQNSYAGYYGYTDYEEVWQTHVPGGSPDFNFYFYNNYWVSTDGAPNIAGWNAFKTPNAPSGLTVVVSGNNVRVINKWWLS
jgi:hypothetical protein